MIRPDLKGKYSESLFIHRDCDPINYSVAVFPPKTDKDPHKTLVMNSITKEIMDYFYDDVSEDSWINITEILKDYKSKINWENQNYSINRSFFIKNNINNKVYNLLGRKSSKSTPYPKIELNNTSILIHVLLSKIFIPNPDNHYYTIVNHKNSIKDDYRLENLEWFTFSLNNLNKNRVNKIINKGIFYTKEDPITNEIHKLTPEEFFRIGRTSWIKDGKIHAGFVWKKIDTKLENYLKNHPIIENGWYTNKFITDSKIEANLNGLIRVDGEYRFGTIKSDNYRVIKIKGKSYLNHVLVYETISGKQIKKGFEIDHIIPALDSLSSDEFKNLKLCTHDENMKNPNTLKNLSINSSRKIYNGYYCFDLFGNLIKNYELYNDIIEDLNLNKQDKSKIADCLSGRRLTYLNYFWQGTSNLNPSLLEFIFYKYNSKGEAIEASARIDFLVEDKKYLKTIYKYINTGKMAPDGFYYWQGTGFQIDINNKSLHKKKKNITYKNSPLKT